MPKRSPSGAAADRAPAPGPTGPARPGAHRSAPGERFALFGECLLAGVLAVLAALPVVTLLPALAAGCAHLRAHIEGEGSTGIADFLARFRSALPGAPGPSLAIAGAAAVLAADVLIVRAGLPGGRPVLLACVVLAAAVAVVALRAAAAWRPGARWPDLLRLAARCSRTDAAGSALLVAALAAAAVAAWALAPLALPMAGCLVLAAVVVDRRR
ncbi:hypothetical protein HDA32_001873 [Spinactinospora alkalitolerans]|uniref:Poxvirus protein I5 n=1 Tax=Spinactinospora alkalitolerans TaxID=687207 RepID=A0A852TVB0_9ACTN|nr:hypothetical protein [Spinactinospora alkalitolerans]NYE46753.1 hypothetical protein [Spinactinospora alkalitolerans]